MDKVIETKCQICGKSSELLENMRSGSPSLGWRFYKICESCSRKAIIDGWKYWDRLHRKYGTEKHSAVSVEVLLMSVSISKDCCVTDYSGVQFWCPHCGTNGLIEAGDKYCSNCGREIEYVYDGVPEEVMILTKKDIIDSAWHKHPVNRYQCKNCLMQLIDEGEEFCSNCRKKIKWDLNF